MAAPAHNLTIRIHLQMQRLQDTLAGKNRTDHLFAWQCMLCPEIEKKKSESIG